MGQPRTAVADCASQVAKRIQGVSQTLNELYDWWVKDQRKEPAVFKEAVRWMIDNRLAYAKNICGVKMLSLDAPKKPVEDPPPGKQTVNEITDALDEEGVPPAEIPEPDEIDDGDDWIGTDEAAKILGVTPSRVYQLAEDGKIISRGVGNGTKRKRRQFSKHSIEAYIDNKPAADAKRIAEARENHRKAMGKPKREPEEPIRCGFTPDGLAKSAEAFEARRSKKKELLDRAERALKELLECIQLAREI